ncbi:MAG: hypothetical protein KAQ84_05355, partial [Thermoplasmatales archaeon]|nr:hypothetical protein [Thermoplasmatales archaeon]
MKHIIPILVILLLLSSGFVGISYSIDDIEQSTIQTFYDGNTLYVGGSGSGNYTQIQDAIDNASDGDTIYVFSGVYDGGLIVDKSIILKGENQENTFIEGT